MRSRWIALICFTGFIVLGISATITGPTLPNLVAAISLPLADGGILRAARQIGAVSTPFLLGGLLDRLDTRRILIPGAILLAVGTGLIAAGGNLGLVLVASLVAGVGSGLYDVGTNYTIGAVFAGSAAAVLAALHTFYGLGSSIGPQVASWAITSGDWRAAYVVALIICLFMALVFLGVRGVQQHKPTHTETVGRPAPVSIPWLPLALLAALIFMYSGAGTGLSDWLFTHVRLVALADVETASQITSLYWLALTGGRILSIFVLHRIGSMTTMGIGLTFSTIGAALVVLGGRQIPLIAIGVALIGLGFAPIYPTVIALGGQLRPAARGRITGILSGMAALGAMTVPVIQGWVGGGQSGGMIVTLIGTLIMVGALIGVVQTRPAQEQL